ncbi:MAG: protein-glutamate O-methyltransferase family protein, partial [Chloroflexi bacterium]|nr:protein-glutamate O-methyltransferase family protein [Chloroflexota bacterium]
GWQAAIAPYEGQPWLQVPWFFAETYLYRRIITAVDHFRSSIDPYLQQKQQSLRSSKSKINTLISQLNQMIAQGWQMENFRQLLLADLWGNQADMSMWAADDANMPSHANSTDQLAHLLADDRLAAQKLLQTAVPQVDFIIDNAGFELVGDLCLADYLLATGRVATVRFHLKLFPTFVSDATMLDVEATVTHFRQSGSQALQLAGERLTDYLINGRLHLSTHPFWTSPHPLWQLPTDLQQKLAAATLIISKGDANYRRALGDAKWPYITPFANIASYLPVPALFLRTCKSEVLAGLAEGREAQLVALEKDWLINGRWGVIQLACPRRNLPHADDKHP